MGGEIEWVSEHPLQPIRGLEDDYEVYSSKITDNKSRLIVRIPKQVRQKFNINGGYYLIFKLHNVPNKKHRIEDLEIYFSNKKLKTPPDTIIG